MKTKLFWCLLGVNLALAGTYLAKWTSANTAVAQAADGAPAYLMFPGEVAGADRGVVYVLDTSNGMLSAMSFGDASGRIDIMSPTDLARVFEEGVR